MFTRGINVKPKQISEGPKRQNIPKATREHDNVWSLMSKNLGFS